jgi:hypothetical protein
MIGQLIGTPQGLVAGAAHQRGGDLVQTTVSEERVEVLVEVGDVRRSRTGLDVLVGQPLLLDVGTKRDVAVGAVVPGPGEHLLLLTVGRAQRFAPGGERAGRAGGSVGVAVGTGVPGAACPVPCHDPCHLV